MVTSKYRPSRQKGREGIYRIVLKLSSTRRANSSPAEEENICMYSTKPIQRRPRSLCVAFPHAGSLIAMYAAVWKLILSDLPRGGGKELKFPALHAGPQPAGVGRLKWYGSDIIITDCFLIPFSFRHTRLWHLCCVVQILPGLNRQSRVPQIVYRQQCSACRGCFVLHRALGGLL
jgi:hypothetical protein